MIVGNVIGISIFILPGPLAGSAGPSVVLATVLAAVPALFVAVFNAQLGSALPVAGGYYVYVSRLVSPFWGFLIPWTVPPAVWAGVLFPATGFAEYTRVFVDIPALPLMAGLILLFLATNLLGIRFVAGVQILMIGVLALAITAFVAGGLPNVSPGNYAPLFPNGATAFALAVVSMYFPYLGFTIITEIGEEIENPGKTIPTVLFTGIAVVFLVFVLMVAVLVGVMDWRSLADTEAAFAVAATGFLPWWGDELVAVGAILGLATSINTIFTVYSRTLMRAARDKIVPQALSTLHDTYETPVYSILILGVPPLFLAPLRPSVVTLSQFTVSAVLLGNTLSAVGLWNLPERYPRHYSRSRFRLSPPVLRLTAVLGALASGALLAVVVLEKPVIGGFYLAWFGLGYVYYRYRIRKYRGLGEDLYERMTSLREGERVEDLH